MRHSWLRVHLALAFIASCFLALPVVRPAGAQTLAAAEKKMLTVERIYGQPSLDGSLAQGIEWSPDGKQVSFFHRQAQGDDGRMELWVMDAASGERRVLVNAEKLAAALPPETRQPTQRTGLGRVTPASYQWSPSGGAMLFAGNHRLVWLDLQTMAARTLVSGEETISDARISPDGRWVSFLRDYNVWVVNVATGETREVTRGGSEELREGQLDWVYPEELDIRTAYWWSPDSSQIAFLEMDERSVTKYPIINLATGGVQMTRYPQAGEANPTVRVGVISINGGEPRWMDTGENRDIYLARVGWLPDSRRIAIQRLNRAQNRLDLLLADAATGQSRVILTETDKYWINLSDDLHFLSDGRRFLWSSERTGYRHLYLYETSGELLETLTSGAWGISGLQGFGPGTASGLAVDEKHGFVYFVSNKDNSTESQLYRLSLGDRSLVRITRAGGIHRILMAPDSSAYVDAYSNAMTPPRQDLYRADGAHVAAIKENRVPQLAEYRLAPVEFLRLPAADGTELQAMMIKPPDFDPSKKYPVLINVYGGPHAQLVRNAWGGVNFLWHEMMAEKGYILFALDNRGSFNRGHAFETPIYHHFGRIELDDQLAGVRYLKSLPYVDGSRIGIWGWSYGGYMTLMAMLNAADAFKAGVSVAPVTDWRLYDTIYTERYMGRLQDNPAGYKESSPVTYSAKLKGKWMVIHGTGDDNVHFANTAELLNDLINAGKYPACIMVFPGRGHPISDPAARIQLFKRMTRFFLKNL